MQSGGPASPWTPETDGVFKNRLDGTGLFLEYLVKSSRTRANLTLFSGVFRQEFIYRADLTLFSGVFRQEFIYWAELTFFWSISSGVPVPGMI